MREDLRFCFKGDRNYVHGTDIFNAAHKFFIDKEKEKPTNIEMSIHKVVRQNMTLVFKEEISASEMPVVHFMFSGSRDAVNIVLVENEEKIECNYEYDEDNIVAAAYYNEVEKAIILPKYEQYTIIEKIVALNKGLLQRIFPDVKGKWYFTKIKIASGDVNSNDPGEIRLYFKKNLNFKLTQSSISIGEKLVGNIYFSLV
jgi:hypothetical protein